MTGFLQPVVLTLILSRTGYGLYASVLNPISIVNNVIVAGSIQAMSKTVTTSGIGALRRGLVFHCLLAAVVGATLVVVSGPLGLGDAQVPPLIRISAIVAANYSVYAALVGALNGQQRFATQAKLDMTFATLRTGLIIALAATPWRVMGSIAGFALASTVIVVIALVVAWPRASERVPASETGRAAFFREYASFFAPVLLYQLALNMVLQADLLVLKRLLLERVSAAQADELVGVYKAVQNFAFLPYQLLLAVTFVVFPVVSKATTEGGRRRRVSDS